MINKKILPIAFLLVTMIVFSTCDEETIWMDEAEITAYDRALCACCGGLLITIDNEAYRFDSIPAGSNVEITSETIFPVLVNVNWHSFEGPCSDMRIVVDAIEERE